jgi:hypothetical protein
VFFVQGLLSLHGRPAVALHSPAVHALADEHVLPSSHVVLSGRSVKVQPLVGEQVSVVQDSLSLQVIALPRHWPPAQTSFVVQALLSVHAAVLLVWLHPLAGMQESVVQTLVSSQLSAVPGAQLPL